MRPSDRAIAEQNRFLAARHRQFRIAADAVATALAALPEVERIALIGSAARPLSKEVPRFRTYRRAGVALWHECQDVDLAVWPGRLDRLETMRRRRAQALRQLLEDTGIGVADHQVDVFLLELGTDRYLGRLCLYNACPKGRPECLVAGCGDASFLRQHEGFRFEQTALAPGRSVTLFDRGAAVRRRAIDLPATGAALPSNQG